MQIDITEERKTQAFKEAMKIDSEHINTFDEINKVYTSQ